MTRSQRAAVMKEKLQSAVAAMEGELQGDLADADLRLFSILGRGGFGTVYHGALTLAA